MSVLVIAVGIPCSGKTTFIRDQFKDYTVLSFDKLLLDYAREYKINYHEVFDALSPTQRESLNRQFEDSLREAITKNQDIVIDRTNLTPEVRKLWIDMSPNHKHIALFMSTTVEECLRRNSARTAFGKYVPDHIIRSMYDRLSVPTDSEGFVRVITIKHDDKN